MYVNYLFTYIKKIQKNPPVNYLFAREIYHLRVPFSPYMCTFALYIVLFFGLVSGNFKLLCS
jgi:hypothetical protein